MREPGIEGALATSISVMSSATSRELRLEAAAGDWRDGAGGEGMFPVGVAEVFLSRGRL